MDSKAKKGGGKSGNLTLTAGSWVITGLGYGKTEKFFESLVALLNFALLLLNCKISDIGDSE